MLGSGQTTVRTIFRRWSLGVLTWRATINEQGPNPDITATVPGQTVAVTGAASTAQHEYWHVTGFSKNKLEALEDKLTDQLNFRFKFDKRERRIGLHGAATEAIKAMRRQLETVVPNAMDTTDAESLATAKSIVESHLTGTVAKTALILEGQWHTIGGFAYNSAERLASVPW